MIDQLGLNTTYFYQLGLFLVSFVVLRATFFGPITRLIELRHKRTVADNAEAEKLEQQNAVKIQEFKDRLSEVRQEIRAERDRAISEARKQDALLIAQAREEAKKLTQNAVAQAEAARDATLKNLGSEIDSLASSLTKKLLSETPGRL